jgi:hypothetical protein
MGRTWKVDAQPWQELLSSITPPAVGATAAHPDMFPTGLGIGRRGEPRNQYVGLVVTRPDANTFVLGLNYFDTADDGDNEDMYRIDTTICEVTPYMRGSFEKDHPEYAGHHRAAKPYLRKPRTA